MYISFTRKITTEIVTFMKTILILEVDGIFLIGTKLKITRYISVLF